MLLSVLASLSLSYAWEEEECSWFDDSDTYYCGYIELTSVPTDIPENTVELLLYENQINSIPPGVFSWLSVCTDLELRRNNITAIGARAFEGFEILKYYYYRPQTKFAKVVFLHVCVCPQGRCLLWGWGSAPRGDLVPGDLVPEGGACSRGVWRPPRDSYCCGWYACYWNAFLLKLVVDLRDAFSLSPNVFIFMQFSATIMLNKRLMPSLVLTLSSG